MPITWENCRPHPVGEWPPDTTGGLPSAPGPPLTSPRAPALAYHQDNCVAEAHAVIVVGDIEVVHVAGEDGQVYEEEHQSSHGENHALWEEEHGHAVPPPHPGGSTDSRQLVQLEQADTAQEEQPTPLVLERTVWNSRRILESGGHREQDSRAQAVSSQYRSVSWVARAALNCGGGLG